MSPVRLLAVALCLAGPLLPLGRMLAAEPPEFQLVIKDHRFTPAELAIPAGTKVRLVVVNDDATPEEFESYDFNREKVVPGHGRIVLFVGPLKPGKYEFFGEFNRATAVGWLVVK